MALRDRAHERDGVAGVTVADGTCPRCGSDDLQKADAIMAEVNAEEGPMTPARYVRIREASKLRTPHMDRVCKVVRIRGAGTPQC